MVNEIDDYRLLRVANFHLLYGTVEQRKAVFGALSRRLTDDTPLFELRSK
jgi:hypothetical protein